MRKIWLAIGLIGLSVVLGATVLREPVAWAAQGVDASIIGPLDDNGNIKVHEQGTANVNVLGKVSTQEAIPAEAFSVFAIGSGGFGLVGPDPAGTAYAISSVTFTNGSDDAQGILLHGTSSATRDCSLVGPTTNGPFAVVPGGDTVHMDFPQPFVVAPKEGATACLVVSHESGVVVGVTLVGYRISSR